LSKFSQNGPDKPSFYVGYQVSALNHKASHDQLKVICRPERHREFDSTGCIYPVGAERNFTRIGILLDSHGKCVSIASRHNEEQMTEWKAQGMTGKHHLRNLVQGKAILVYDAFFLEFQQIDYKWDEKKPWSSKRRRN
jgi:hypothetical protein